MTGPATISLSGCNFDQNQVYDCSVNMPSIMDVNANEWKNQISSKPKLRRYVKYKSSFEAESYVKAVGLSKRDRSLLCQFRVGILPLRIETGRFRILKDLQTNQFRHLRVEERVCELCNLGQVEDELHFLCHCPLYKDLREIMYQKANMSEPEFNGMEVQEKFNYLMKNLWREMCTYISNAWDLRKSNLYH